MKFLKLKDHTSERFDAAWKIYESSFPPNERRSLNSQKVLIKNKSYNFLKVTKEDRTVAIVAYWNLKDFLFVEHVAVNSDLRGQGFGEKIFREYFLKKGKEIVLEVEKPKNEEATRRIKFYEKIGFKLNYFNYIQPAYEKKKVPVELLLMTYPSEIKEKKFLEIKKKLYEEVYGVK